MGFVGTHHNENQGGSFFPMTAVQELSFRGCWDPFRNPRDVQSRPEPWGWLRVWGWLVDDSAIHNQPRERVQTLPFHVLVRANASLREIQEAIHRQTSASPAS